VVRTLEARATAAFFDRAERDFGAAGRSIALLACAFRALARASPRRPAAGERLAARIGCSLRPPRGADSMFSDLSAELLVAARADALDDREVLTRQLLAQLREQLRQRAELGCLAAELRASRHLEVTRRHFDLHAAERSLGYGLFRAAAVETLCGARVGRLYNLSMARTPPGLNLSATHFSDRLTLALAFSRGDVPQRVVETFAEALTGELTHPG
jgi:hypothetical protein